MGLRQVMGAGNSRNSFVTEVPAVGNLFIHFASMCNDQHMYLPGAVVDPIDHAPFAQPEAQTAGEFSREAFDVVVPARVVFQMAETARQFAGKRRIGGGEKSTSLRREDNFKHPNAPCASSHLFL